MYESIWLFTCSHIDDSVLPSSPNGSSFSISLVVVSKVDELYSTMMEAKDPHNRKEHLKMEHAYKKKKDKKKKDSTPTDAAQSSTPAKGEQLKAEQSKKGKKLCNTECLLESQVVLLSPTMLSASSSFFHHFHHSPTFTDHPFLL